MAAGSSKQESIGLLISPSRGQVVQMDAEVAKGLSMIALLPFPGFVPSPGLEGHDLGIVAG